MKTVLLRIASRVQGVGYRMWAERAALSLGISGWVRNRRDGSVELLASGTEDAVAALIEACGQGPRAAVVADVTVEDAADDGSVGFSARPTI